MSIKSLIYINYCLLLHKLHSTYLTYLITYLLFAQPCFWRTTKQQCFAKPEVGKIPLPQWKIYQKLEKFHFHSGQFTKSWKNPTPKVENWKPNKHSVDHLPLILFFYTPWSKKCFSDNPPKYSFEKKEEKKKKCLLTSSLTRPKKKY